MRSFGRRTMLQKRTATCCAQFLSSRSTASSTERRTYFDYLDSMWNRKWFGVSEADVPPLHEPSFVTNSLVSFQEGLGLGPPEAILLLGALSRLVTLGFSLYGERASERMRNAVCRLKVPHERYQRVYHSEGATSLDVQLAATALKGERRRVFAEEGTSNVRCLSSVLGSPIVLFGLFQTRVVCENPYLEFGTSPFLWCPALTMPDPYGILPLMFCALTLANFELSITKKLKTGWMSSVVGGARLGCLCVLPVVLQFRSGICLYFLGMGLMGLLQPLLLRSTWFRSRFNFPIDAKKDPNTNLYANEGFQTRMSVQFPYVSHLFDGTAEQNVPLVKRSATCPEAVHTGQQRAVEHRGESLLGSSRRFDNKTISRRGIEFATPGWKTRRVDFSEEDFIPDHNCFDERTGDAQPGEKMEKGRSMRN